MLKGKNLYWHLTLSLAHSVSLSLSLSLSLSHTHTHTHSGGRAQRLWCLYSSRELASWTRPHRCSSRCVCIYIYVYNTYIYIYIYRSLWSIHTNTQTHTHTHTHEWVHFNAKHYQMCVALFWKITTFFTFFCLGPYGLRLEEKPCQVGIARLCDAFWVEWQVGKIKIKTKIK
jgi:hypothetical protein